MPQTSRNFYNLLRIYGFFGASEFSPKIVLSELRPEPIIPIGAELG
jgi:hypothetical protein